MKMIRSSNDDKQIVIYTDLHIGAPNSTHTAYSFAKAVKQDIDNKKRVVLLGDIVDMANVKKSEVKEYLELTKYYMNLFETDLNPIYILGNHERMSTEQDVYIQDHRAFLHGDLLDNPERWAKYRMKPHGAGWFKRTIWVRLIMLYEKFFDRKPSDRLKQRAKEWVKEMNSKGENITELHIGHFHYSARVNLGEFTLICHDQGRHEL